ncbi:hypothetical protein T484DRAFT_1825353 [Baffinella frigidus]|nr:hypothetical protein T484DRAFT_1825353 [Cryptophyta sp. CCMP2293]
MAEKASTEPNVALAFGMVIGAGLCTSIGAAVAFCVPLENKRFLAVSLAISAGVMIYVSMVEIFVKALSAFSDEWCPERPLGASCPRAYSATTGAFFSGIAIVALMNAIVSPTSIAFVRRKLGCAGEEEEDGETPLVQWMADARPIAPGWEVKGETPLVQWMAHARPIAPGWEVQVSKMTGLPFYVSKSTGLPFYVNPASGDVKFDPPDIEAAQI